MQHIFIKYLNNQCSPEEVEALLSYFNNPANETLLKELILKNLEKEEIAAADLIQWQQVADQCYANIKEQINEQTAQVIPLQKRFWFRAVAAAIIFMVISGTYYLLDRNEINKEVLVNTTLPTEIQAPTTNKAIITLSNGQQVPIDSLSSGQLAMQGNMLITKNSKGEIIYSGDNNENLAYNTLYNPRGSKVQTLTLADGTQVWLNAESSLRYPVAFTGKERKVEITGEAYFEVAHNTQMPFYVSTNEVSVKVLGTHFNVNAYADENLLKVTLLEGSVNVSKGSAALKLIPGQQAEIGTTISLNKDCNTEEVMAWKNEKFAFYEADITTIMHQLARWYNLNVVFEGKINHKFHVEITRNTNISNVIKILEGTGGVHLKVEGNKVIVTP